MFLFFSYELLVLILTLFVLLLGLYIFNPIQHSDDEQVTWRCFVKNYLQTGFVGQVEIVNNKWVRVVMTRSSIPNVWMLVTNGFEKDFDDEVQKLNCDVKLTYKNESDLLTRIWHVALTFINFFLFLVFMFACFWSIGKGTLQMWNSEKNDDYHLFLEPTIIDSSDISERFSNVVGCDNAKLEITDLVNFLTNPAIYIDIGAKSPRGTLLTGPPGTGKITLAKAVAGEAGVSFISMSGFKNIYAGMGAQKIKQLFSLARENLPCIIFIDDIDDIGTMGQNGDSSESEDSDNTLRQLLVEMDGHTDILDEALLRPGRFDRLIEVPVPDIHRREELFKIYLLPIHLGTAIDKECLAKKLAVLTADFTGEQIAQVCNDAAILAIRQNQQVVRVKNFEQAILRTLAGHGSKTIKWSDHERRVTAYHEAGHVVAGWFSKHAYQFIQVSILPLDDYLGFTRYLVEEHIDQTEEHLMAELFVCLGGRLAEKIIFGVFTVGAKDDLRKFTNMAYELIMTYGFNPKLGPINFEDTEPKSEEFAKLIDLEVQRLAASVEKTTEELLRLHVKELHAIAEALLEENILSAKNVIDLIGPRPFQDEYLIDESTCEIDDRD